MATIELDIIKQRSDRLLANEKIELIEYLRASLSSEEREQVTDEPSSHDDDLSDEELAS